MSISGSELNKVQRCIEIWNRVQGTLRVWKLQGLVGIAGCSLKFLNKLTYHDIFFRASFNCQTEFGRFLLTLVFLMIYLLKVSMSVFRRRRLPHIWQIVMGKLQLSVNSEPQESNLGKCMPTGGGLPLPSDGVTLGNLCLGNKKPSDAFELAHKMINF